MSFPFPSSNRPRQSASRRRGFTLAEILIATALTLLLMAAVVRLFATVTESVSDSRAILEISQLLQSTQATLQDDLRYATARGIPPLDPDDDLGYLEIIDGPGPYVATGAALDAISPGIVTRPVRIEDGGVTDTTVGDMDDILMLTVRSHGEPFYGRWQIPLTATFDTVQSQDAEICWFVRGNKLYRRVRLIAPGGDAVTQRFQSMGMPSPFDYQAPFADGLLRFNDVALHLQGTTDPDDSEYLYKFGDNRIYEANNADLRFVASSLGDLTKRENRFGHYPYHYPHDARSWGPAGLPTHGDTSHALWSFPRPWGFSGDNPLGVTGSMTVPGQPEDFQYLRAVDYWRAPYQDAVGAPARPIIDPTTGEMVIYEGDAQDNTSRVFSSGVNYSTITDVDARFGEDVILDNVIGFDVKVWDPGAPVFEYPAAVGQLVYPGDPGYHQALVNFYQGVNPTPLIVGYGAFADLYFARGLPAAVLAGLTLDGSQFAGPGFGDYLVAGGPDEAAVYDTGSTHYERDGFDNDGDGLVDEAVDGIDNDPMDGIDNELFDGIDNDLNGIVDDASEANGVDDAGEHNGADDIREREALPPYPVPLRSIQVKIRIFEPDSQTVREVTVSHDFIN